MLHAHGHPGPVAQLQLLSASLECLVQSQRMLVFDLFRGMTANDALRTYNMITSP